MADRWAERARAAEAELHRLRGIEGREISARVLARQLFRALAARTGLEVGVLVEAMAADPAVQRIADPTFDAAETLWERHRVCVVPCRTILDGGAIGSLSVQAPQPEMYLGRWPDGSTRNLSRAELLMMGGQDPENV